MMTNDDASREPAARSGHPTLVYLVIGLASLAVGAAGTWLVLRSRPAGATVVSAAAGESGQSAGHEGMPGMGEPADADGPAASSEKSVYIPAERQQLIGVRTAEVGERDLDTTIRTVGTIAYDETRLTQVHTKISGWVEKVFVDSVGKAVRRNEPLFSVYSPELVSTENEYLLALENRDEFGASRSARALATAEALLSAAHDRLRLWDVPEEHIQELEATREAQKALMIHAPFDGVVLERMAFPGQYITPEMAAFKIVDLSTIWVIGAVFEYELPLIRLGQEAEIEFPHGQATRSLKGRLSFIYPEIDPQTRRVRVRAEFANPGLQFRPETYVTVLIHTGGGHHLAIPKEAVIDTGTKQYAMLALPNGYFEPREVQVGQSTDEFYPLLGGLQKGDSVVTSAQFLIDSETNLKSAMQSMAGMPGMDMPATKPKVSTPSPVTGHEGHQR